MSTHAPFQLVSGDDWEIKATLLDENGVPYNLSPAPQILWTLVSHAGQRVINASDVGITIINAAQGICSILVPSIKTTAIPGGKYTDALRIVIGGVTSTLLIGPVNVTADPWQAVPVPAGLRAVA